jgi:hypothetical protein
LLIDQGREQVAHDFGQPPQRAMDAESATKGVEAVGVDAGEQETRPKKEKSGGTERVPGRSVFPVARVQKILKADKVSGTSTISIYLREFIIFGVGTTYSSKRGRLSRLGGYSASIVDHSYTLNV